MVGAEFLKVIDRDEILGLCRRRRRRCHHHHQTDDASAAAFAAVQVQSLQVISSREEKDVT